MPRLRNDRRTTLATSASQPARMLGRASRTVTLVPRSPIIDANSQPMAPPPMTAAEAGRPLIENSSSEVTTSSPSTSKPPMVRGVEPEARMIDCADSVWTEPSSAATATEPEGPSEPTPEWTVTLRCPSSEDSPASSWSMTRCLRASTADQSRLGSPAPTPNSPALATVRYTEAASRSSLAGMQPTCRQVPPTLFFSTTPTSRPALAPYRAAAYPPGPPPMTIASCAESLTEPPNLPSLSATLPGHGAFRTRPSGPAR